MTINDVHDGETQERNGGQKSARPGKALSKVPSMEDMSLKWMNASPEHKIAAMSALREGNDQDSREDDLRVIRWQDAASRLSVTTRCVRDAAKALGIKPVRMPGRNRAIGLRARDLRLIIDGSAA